jgi:hypothetical protein
LLVSGVWDGIGLLFGVSGFLFFAGPAVFSSFSERWRLYWLLGRGNAPVTGLDGAWQFWIFLSILYFSIVVGASAFLLWRQRRLTAIYNVEVERVEWAVTQICEELGLNPVRSGGMFLFGLSLGAAIERRGANGERIQAPHYLPSGIRAAGPDSIETLAKLTPGTNKPDSSIVEQTAILELENFALMRHVTLRWDPADSPLRQIVETQLSQRLAEEPANESLLGGWLLTIGFLLLAFEFLGAFAMILLHQFLR